MKKAYEKNGYFMVKAAINEEHIQSLIKTLSLFENEINQYGIRDLMNKVPEIRDLALSIPLITLAKKILGNDVKPVRAIFFDKLPDANWNVAWHQDTSIVVTTKANLPGFKAWRKKQGTIHVEPPEEYLANIMALRIHLDPANTETGGLRMIPQSHKNGRTNSKTLLEIVEKSEVTTCTAHAGDILLMNPLIFHSSRKATKPNHRRVIHFEYSAMSLPNPLEWYESKTLQYP